MQTCVARVCEMDPRAVRRASRVKRPCCDDRVETTTGRGVQGTEGGTRRFAIIRRVGSFEDIQRGGTAEPSVKREQIGREVGEKKGLFSAITGVNSLRSFGRRRFMSRAQTRQADDRLV